MLKNSSRITGKQIIFAAPKYELVVSDDSSLWASGQSIMTQGTNDLGTGAAFTGQAGYCGKVSGFDSPEFQNVYGYYRQVPEAATITESLFEIGSIGKKGDIETAGGGRIALYFDSMTL